MQNIWNPCKYLICRGFFYCQKDKKCFEKKYEFLLAAFLLMALLFHREIANLTKKALTAGLFLGFLFFVTMAFEMLALKQAASSLAVQQGNLTGGFTYGLLSAMTYALAIIASLLFPYLFRSTSP